MATDAGPYYYRKDTNEAVFYYGWFNESTGEMLELSKSQYYAYWLQNVQYGSFSDYVTFVDSFLGPGFTQQWGALGYFIRPEYLDKFSPYRPQVMVEGNIPLPGYIGQYR